MTCVTWLNGDCRTCFPFLFFVSRNGRSCQNRDPNRGHILEAWSIASGKMFGSYKMGFKLILEMDAKFDLNMLSN
jgi:hypothetical protein